MSDAPTAGSHGPRGTRPNEGWSALADRIARSVQDFLDGVEALARGEGGNETVPLLLLEVSQIQLAGAQLGATTDIIPADNSEGAVVVAVLILQPVGHARRCGAAGAARRGRARPARCRGRGHAGLMREGGRRSGATQRQPLRIIFPNGCRSGVTAWIWSNSSSAAWINSGGPQRRGARSAEPCRCQVTRWPATVWYAVASQADRPRLGGAARPWQAEH